MEHAHQIQGSESQEGISWEEQERRELESLLKREGKVECEEVLGAAGSSGIYQQRLCVVICFIWLLQGVGLYQLPLLFQSPKLMCTAESFQQQQGLKINAGIILGSANELGVIQQSQQQEHTTQGFNRQQQLFYDKIKNHTETQTFSTTNFKVIQLHSLNNSSSKQQNSSQHQYPYPLKSQSQFKNLTLDPKAIFECWESPKVCDVTPVKIAAASGGQSSLTSEFMLLCDLYSLKVIMVACFFLGCAAGTILTQSILSGKTVGTAMLLKMSLPLEGISVLALSFIESSYEGVCLSLFGCGLFGFSSWSSSLAIIRESCSKQQFAHYRSVLFLANATAQMTITPFYSYMHDWRRELIYVVALPIMFLGLSIVPFLILESPAYFLRTRNPEKLYKVLSKIAGINSTKCFFTKAEFMEVFEKMTRNSQFQGRLDDQMGQQNAEGNLNIMISNEREDNGSNDNRFLNQETIEYHQEEEDHKSQEQFTHQRSLGSINQQQQQQQILKDNHSLGKGVVIREFELASPASVRKVDKNNGNEFQMNNKENNQRYSGVIQTTAGSTDPMKVTDRNNNIFYTSSLSTVQLQGPEINYQQIHQEKQHQNKKQLTNNQAINHDRNGQNSEENKYETEFQQWKPSEELENVSNKRQAQLQQFYRQDSGEIIQDGQSQKKSIRSIKEQTETIRSQNRSQRPQGQQYSQSENIPQSNNATSSMHNRHSMAHYQPFNNTNNLNDLAGNSGAAFSNSQPSQLADQEIRNNPIMVLPIRNESRRYVQNNNVPFENNVCEESELETLAVTTKSALCAHMRRVAQYVIAQMILTSFYYGIFFEMEKFGVNLSANMFVLGFSEFVAILATDKLLEFHPPRYSLKQTLFIIGVISATVFVVRHSPLDDLEQPLNNTNANSNSNLPLLKVIELFLLGMIRFFTISGFSLILVKCKSNEPTQAFRQNAWKAIASFGSLGLLIPPALLFATQDIYPTFFLLGLVSVLASFLTQDA